MSQTESICKCQQWDTCEWSKSVLNTISLHQSNHPTRKFAEYFFKERKCSLRQRKVFCCNGKDAPTLAQMEMLSFGLRTDSKKEFSGQWIPDAEMEECGEIKPFKFLRIAKGRVTNIGDYPFMALLKSNTTGCSI